jgi:hypothetical protein
VAVVILHVHKYGKKKKVPRKIKSGGLHERHAIATWEPSQHSLVDTGKHMGKENAVCLLCCRGQREEGNF